MRSKWAWVAIVFGLVLSAQVSVLPVENAAGAEDIVATARWETQGADVDLLIVGPNNQTTKAAQDQMSGPATEVATVPNPGPGEYKVGVIWQNDKPNMQVPVTVEVKQGDKLVGTFPVVLSAGNPNDRKIVTSVMVGGGAPVGDKDALGLAGRWVEYWPGVGDHDVSIVTFQNGQYQVQVANPKTGPYKVDSVRIEGNVLKFTEYPGSNTIQYEVAPQDANTCAVKVQGGPTVNGQIVWKREGGGGTTTVPAGGAGDLVVTMKWETQGADVDLSVTGPDGEAFRPAQDVTTGPGAEVCTIRNARPGDYKARVLWMNDKQGVQVAVTVEAKLGDKVVGTFQASLDSDNDRRVFSGIKVAP
jgi:uncharacterized protein YfaP (DUF2135 family)